MGSRRDILYVLIGVTLVGIGIHVVACPQFKPVDGALLCESPRAESYEQGWRNELLGTEVVLHADAVLLRQKRIEN